jgi:hypothetical protein
MDTAAEFRKHAANRNNTAEPQQHGKSVSVEGSGEQSSLQPHARTMAFVRQIGRRRRAISSTNSSAKSNCYSARICDPRIASPEMFLNKSPPMTGAATPNRVGVPVGGWVILQADSQVTSKRHVERDTVPQKLNTEITERR